MIEEKMWNLTIQWIFDLCIGTTVYGEKWHSIGRWIIESGANIFQYGEKISSKIKLWSTNSSETWEKSVRQLSVVIYHTTQICIPDTSRCYLTTISHTNVISQWQNNWFPFSFIHLFINLPINCSAKHSLCHWARSQMCHPPLNLKKPQPEHIL